MSDSIPTFRRAWLALRGSGKNFSYADSLVARGAVWALVVWLPVPLLASLVQALSAWATEVGAEVSYMPEAGTLLLMTAFPWAPLAAFTLACAFSGRASGWLDALGRGLKACAALITGLMALASLMIFAANEKAGLVAAILFWIGVLAALMALLGSLLRHLYDKLKV